MLHHRKCNGSAFGPARFAFGLSSHRNDESTDQLVSVITGRPLPCKHSSSSPDSGCGATTRAIRRRNHMIATKTITGLTLACALAVGSACAGVRKKTVDINTGMNCAPTCAAPIAVYNSRADVPYDYYELAWIEAQGNSVWTTDNQLQQQIR